MRVMITGRHIDVTPALRRYIHDRVKRLDRYGVKPGGVQVILSVEKHRHTAEVVVPVNRAVIQSKVSTTEMYGSIDQLFDKVNRQLVKRKEKLTTHKTRAPRTVRPEDRQPATPASEIKTVRVPVPTVSLEDAVARLEQDGHPLVVFLDAGSRRLGVLHRLQDGSLQLLEPEY